MRVDAFWDTKKYLNLVGMNGIKRNRKFGLDECDSHVANVMKTN